MADNRRRQINQVYQNSKKQNRDTMKFSPGVTQTGGGKSPPTRPAHSAADSVSSNLSRAKSFVQNKAAADTRDPDEGTIKAVGEDAKVFVNASIENVRKTLQKKNAQKTVLASSVKKATVEAETVKAPIAVDRAKQNVQKYVAARPRSPAADIDFKTTATQADTVKLSDSTRMTASVYQHRKVAGNNNILNDISHGSPLQKAPIIKTSSDKTRVWRSYTHTNTTLPHQNVANTTNRAKAMQQRTLAAKKAKKTAKGAKTVSNAIKKGGAAVTKSAAAGIKGLIPLLLGAWPVVLIAIILIVIVAVISTPIGALLSSGSEESPVKVEDMVSRISSEWSNDLKATRERYETQGYKVTVEYGAPGIGDASSRVNNWKDCLALYVVANNDGQTATTVFKPEDEQPIRELYFKMNPISVTTRVEVEEKEVETEKEVVKKVWNPDKKIYEEVKTKEKVKETVQEEVRYADITVLNKRWIQMLDVYPLDDEQKKFVEFMLKPENDALWEKMGIYNAMMPGGGFNGNIADIMKNLPPGQLGSAIVEAALTRLGDPYSMEMRGQGRYIDCSGLTMWAYAQCGISIPWTAADQGKWCVDKGLVIDPSTAEPGDLIFWSYPNSSRVKNRFMAIGHVAIYAGGGMMVEAAPSAGCVTYRAVSVQGEPVFYARAHLGG